MREIFIIGDIHGHLEKLSKLIEIIKPDAEEIVLVGDLIDRGPNSIGVLEYAINNNLTVIRGNHEEIMKEALLDESKCSMDLWMDSGGKTTLNEYKNHKNGNNLLIKHLEYINKLPYYKIFRSYDDRQHRRLIVSHAPICDLLKGHSPNKLNQDLFLWNRKIPKIKTPFFNVFGHNIVSEFVKNKSGGVKVDKDLIHMNTLIDKDVGYAAIDSDVENFKLTAIGFPSMRIVQV